MAKKKKNNILMWILIVGAMLILLKVDWTNPLASSQFVEKEKAETSLGENLGGGGGGGGGDGTQPEAKWITLSVSPSEPCLGDVAIGDIVSNIPNTQCLIQYRFTNLMVWKTLATINLNSAGKYTQQAPANNLGSITFRVVCGSLVSNQQTVTIKNCPSQTTYNCFDSDLGLDFTVLGNCQSNFDNVGYADGCLGSETYMREYYCDGYGKCQWIPNTNWICSQMACNQIVHPSGQASCDLGNCISGLTCTYIPATTTVPASCGCQGVA